MAEAALAIEMGCEVADIGHTIHPHPTLSESVGMAAEAYDGTITDLYMPKKKSPATGPAPCAPRDTPAVPPNAIGVARRGSRGQPGTGAVRSEEHTTQLQSLIRISY